MMINIVDCNEQPLGFTRLFRQVPRAEIEPPLHRRGKLRWPLRPHTVGFGLGLPRIQLPRFRCWQRPS